MTEGQNLENMLVILVIAIVTLMLGFVFGFAYRKKAMKSLLMPPLKRPTGFWTMLEKKQRLKRKPC